MTQTIRIDDEDYIVPDKTAVELSAYLTKVWYNLGKPTDVFTDAGKKLLRVIIASYVDLYPQEYKQWRANIAEYRKNELSTKEQVRKHTGRSLASIPEYVYKMLKAFFKNEDDRKYWIKLMKILPELQVTNNL